MWTRILLAALQLAPQAVQSAETIFSKRPGSGPEKARAALKMAEAGIVVALGMKAELFGDAEKKLVGSIHNAVVEYYNEKGWPTT
jgi:hypothetical protein